MLDIKKLMQLSQIELDDSNYQKFNHKVEKLLEWVKCLEEVETKNVEPMFSIHDYLGDTLHNLQEDVANKHSLQAEILQNAPDVEDVFISVPKVIK